MDGADHILESVSIVPLSFSPEFVATLREMVSFALSIGLSREAIHAREQRHVRRASRALMTEGQAETFSAMVRRLIDAIIDES